MMLIDVDGGGYALACEACYDANHGVVGAVSALTDVAARCAAMAGNDSGGGAWAATYDAAAAAAVRAGGDLGTTLATLAHLLDATLANHEAADGGALLYGGVPVAGGGVGRGAVELSVSGLPSAAGGTGAQPTWWHWVAGHLLELAWPDADTGCLRTVGAGWLKAGDALSSHRYEVDTAAAMVADQISPEVADAVAACDEVSGHLRALAAAYRTLGHACLDYAQAVEDHHHEIEHELASFIEWTVGIEALGALAGLVTAGGAEGPAQAAEAGRVAAAVAQVRRILTALAGIADTIAATIGAAMDVVEQVIARLGKFLGVKVERALVEVGVEEAEEELPRLLASARQLQMKFKHAGDFGFYANYSPASARQFADILAEFLNAPNTTRVVGTYRGQPAIISYDETTGLAVVQHLDGSLWSAWRMRDDQLWHVMHFGSLGGG